MSLPETAVVHHADRIAARVVDGRAMVVVVDERRLHSLNEVGTRVWELSDGKTIGAIADEIAAEYEVERTVALQDIISLIESLRDVGAVSVEAG